MDAEKKTFSFQEKQAIPGTERDSNWWKKKKKPRACESNKAKLVRNIFLHQYSFSIS
jgi:hypothetical protein